MSKDLTMHRVCSRNCSALCELLQPACNCLVSMQNGRPHCRAVCRRGGRDGREAACILLYSYADAQKTRHMLREGAKENNTPEEQLRVNMESLNTMVCPPACLYASMRV